MLARTNSNASLAGNKKYLEAKAMHVNEIATLLDTSLDLQLAEDVPPCAAKLTPERLKQLARGRIPDQFFQTATFLSSETEAHHSAIIRIAFTTAHWQFGEVAAPTPSASKSHSFGHQLDFRQFPNLDTSRGNLDQIPREFVSSSQLQDVSCNHCDAKGVVPCHQCSGQGYFAKAVIAKLQVVETIEAVSVRKNGQTLRVQAPSNSAQWTCHRGQKSTQRLFVSELAARQINETAARYLRTYEDALRKSVEEYEATAARWTKGYLPPALGMIINAMAEAWDVYRIDLEWEASKETFWNRIKKKLGWSKPTRGLVTAIVADLQQITEDRVEQIIWSPNPVANWRGVLTFSDESKSYPIMS